EHPFLKEEVMNRRRVGSVPRRLEEHREGLLDPSLTGALRDVEQTDEIENERRREGRVLAEEVDLHLHRNAGKSDKVDVVPRLFGIAARLVIVDMHLMVRYGVADDGIEHGRLRYQLGLVGAGSLEDAAIVVSEDVRGIPPLDAKPARTEHRGQSGLHEGL